MIRRIGQAALGSSAFYSILSLLLAFIVGGIILVIAGYDPFEGYRFLFIGAFGDGDAWANTLAKATPLIFTGLAVAVAFRGGMFNIGAEGQLYLGAFAAALVGIYWTGLPGILHMVVTFAAAALVGAIWAGLAGFMKVAFKAHEVIVTIMLNYIAIFLTDYLVNYTFKAEGMVPRTEAIASAVHLPILVQHSQLTLGIVFAFILSLFLYWFFRNTVQGYEIRALGLNPSAAETGGISIKRRLVVTMLISGAVAALAGAVEVMGVHHYFIKGMSPGYGFDGIAVAVLARNHPLGVLVSAILFGALRAGSMTMDRKTDIPGDFVVIIQALVIIFVAVPWVVKKVKASKERRANHG